MKTYYECYPCFLKQALKSAQLSGADDHQQYTVLQRTLAMLQTFSPEATPPEIGYEVYQIVREVAGSKDPYRQEKLIHTQQALALYPRLKELVRQSSEPLKMAMRISIAGNIIDMAMKDHFDDLWETVERVSGQPFAIDDSDLLFQRLEQADWLLYLADNAGETVFDRVFIEELPIPVTYVVKDAPILNDALMSDAVRAGLDGCAGLISNGSQALGTILALCSDEFMQKYHSAPVIIAKGQANYETLSDVGEKVFCLLQAKCPVIGMDLNVPVNSIIVRQSKPV